jgi:hypothetical protein
MDPIPYDFDDSRPSFTSPLFDSKPSGFCNCYGTYRGSGTLHFTVPSPIYEPPSHSTPLYTFGFRFSPLLRTISAVPDTPLLSLYSIPSSVISVVAIAVIEVPGTYFNFRSPPSIYGSLFRFSNPPLPPPRPVMPALRR